MIRIQVRPLDRLRIHTFLNAILVHVRKDFFRQALPNQVNRDQTTLFPVVKKAHDCSNCTQCVKACPSGSLQQSGRGKDLQMMLNFATCFSCGLCVDVCPDQVMKMASIPLPPATERSDFIGPLRTEP